MADHRAIAAVSQTLRDLLRDRMQATDVVTLAPPDQTVSGISDGRRVNLYLLQVLEAPELLNQEPPGRGWPEGPGRPPLSLRLRYIMTAHGASEDQEDSDVNAQAALGDAMLVLHLFSGRLGEAAFTDPGVGTVGDQILSDVLREDYENIKITLMPADMEDLSRFWSAMSEENFRRSVVYEVSLVQMEPDEPRRQPRPVETRRVLASLKRRPIIERAFVTPPTTSDPEGEGRVRIGEEITIVALNTRAERLYVRLGDLEPIRVSPTGSGRIRITVPDDQYPADLDNPAPRPIPPAERLQPGPLEVRLVADYEVEGVEGGLDRGTAVSETRRFTSASTLMLLVPQVIAINPVSGDTGTVLQVSGTRLWHAGANRVEVLLGDAAIEVVPPQAGDPWAAPTPTAVEVPLTGAGQILPTPPASGTAYPVFVGVDGATSRDSGIDFTLLP
jgi:hypothetical protein